MKGYCYIVLLIGFFVFYQDNSMYAIIIVVLFIGAYLFFKSRKSQHGTGVMSFLSGHGSPQENRMDDLITLMMIQQLLNSSDSNDNRNRVVDEREVQIEATKKKILELLDDE